MRWLGRKWEWIKAVAIVLWPIRLILLIKLVMIAILSLPQAQDALYGAVTEESGWLAAGVFIAVTAWAVETWYWSRFLFDHTQTRGFPAPIYGIAPLGGTAACLETWVPRLLGAAVFWIVGLFALGSGASWWVGAEYGLAGLIFFAATVGRRRLLVGMGIVPVAPPPPLPQVVSRLAGAAAVVWLVLLSVALCSALWLFPPWTRQLVSLLIVAVLAATSIMLALRLPLPPWTRVMVIGLTVLNSLLFWGSIVMAARLGAGFGPAIVLMLTAGAWVGVTSFFLALPGERLRLPVTSLFVGTALVFGFIPKFVPPLLGYSQGDFDNHPIRGELAAPAADDRAGLKDAFRVWKAQAPCIKGSDPCVKPMILVAAAGGASRSGYWVASVLGSLEDEIDGFSFHRSVFVISGVSGGSLGTAVYQRLIARKMAKLAPLCGGDADPSESVGVCGQRVVQHDFLGPVFFSMFNADLMQRLLPGDLMPDRAEALETAWEQAWRREIGTNDFAEPLRIHTADQLAKASKDDWLPVVFLNGASIKTGRRIITSDIAIEPKCQSSDGLDLGPDVPSAVDFFCLTRQQIPLSTAVHNSARFPFISPVGSLWANDGAGHSWKADRIGDGGYVEAEGASPLVDIVATLTAELPNWMDGLLPIEILIENDPPPPERSCDGAAADDVRCARIHLKELLGDEALPMSGALKIANDFVAPVVGLFSSRTGRGAYAARALEVEFYHGGMGQPKDKGGGVGWPTYRLNLKSSQGPSPAMSWYLSRRSQRDMAADLCPAAGLPKAKLDEELDQLGLKLGVGGLSGRIVSGEGCMDLKTRTKGAGPP